MRPGHNLEQTPIEFAQYEIKTGAGPGGGCSFAWSLLMSCLAIMPYPSFIMAYCTFDWGYVGARPCKCIYRNDLRHLAATARTLQHIRWVRRARGDTFQRGGTPCQGQRYAT